MKGSLKADDMARTLVPSLLKKADRIKRGCTSRTGSTLPASAGNGLHELGFMLGGALQNEDLQRAFGISRSSAKQALPPMTNPLLPNFFMARDTVLVDNVITVNALLHDEDEPERTAYMLARDEVVYAKSMNLIYGMCFLVCN